jgi:hypothetical protein
MGRLGKGTNLRRSKRLLHAATGVGNALRRTRRVLSCVVRSWCLPLLPCSFPRRSLSRILRPRTLRPGTLRPRSPRRCPSLATTPSPTIPPAARRRPPRVSCLRRRHRQAGIADFDSDLGLRLAPCNARNRRPIEATQQTQPTAQLLDRSATHSSTLKRPLHFKNHGVSEKELEKSCITRFTASQEHTRWLVWGLHSLRGRCSPAAAEPVAPADEAVAAAGQRPTWGRW